MRSGRRPTPQGKMAETLHLPPFPELSWDGFNWRAPFDLPWFAVPANAPHYPPHACELIVCPDPAAWPKNGEAASPFQPTDSQVDAFREFLTGSQALQASIMAACRKNIPELTDVDWDAVQSFLELSTIKIFYPAWEDVSYVGLQCNTWEPSIYDGQGIGMVLHRDRVVHVGFGAEANDETQVLKDLRRQSRGGGTKRK